MPWCRPQAAVVSRSFLPCSCHLVPWATSCCPADRGGDCPASQAASSFSMRPTGALIGRWPQLHLREPATGHDRAWTAQSVDLIQSVDHPKRGPHQSVDHRIQTINSPLPSPTHNFSLPLSLTFSQAPSPAVSSLQTSRLLYQLNLTLFNIQPHINQGMYTSYETGHGHSLSSSPSFLSFPYPFPSSLPSLIPNALSFTFKVKLVWSWVFT